ncbi:MAG: hypothetical protein MJY74_01835 [Bacteroidaceae bacterium]|nr:hypothetical protein [Bacteroidaceae bacterium]
MAHIEKYIYPSKEKQDYFLGELEVGEERNGQLDKGVFRGIQTEKPITMNTGVIEMNNGSKFAGFFEENEKDYGIQFFANGVKFFGTFYEDRPDNGIVIFPDGAVMITDEFDENGYMINGLFYWPDGRWLEGSLVDGMVVRGNYVEGDVVHTISKGCSIDLRAYHI